MEIMLWKSALIAPLNSILIPFLFITKNIMTKQIFSIKWFQKSLQVTFADL